jgi:hypothetical protein
MTELLKKYLVIKWWIPLLFFGISFIIFITGIILPNTDFGFNLFAFSVLILLISSIWQIIKGKKKTGFALLSTALTPIFALGFMAYLFAGTINKPDEKLDSERIEPLIREKTDLTIPNDFEILENLIEHTKGAFDSDYSIGLKIKYQESEEKHITEQIRNGIKSKSEKGIWKRNLNGFDFEHNGNEINRAEPFYFKVDTLSNTIELNLMHL